MGAPGLVIPAVMYVQVVTFTFLFPGMSQLVVADTVATVLFVAVAVTTALPVLTLIDSEPAACACVVISKPSVNTNNHR